MTPDETALLLDATTEAVRSAVIPDESLSQARLLESAHALDDALHGLIRRAQRSRRRRGRWARAWSAIYRQHQKAEQR